MAKRQAKKAEDVFANPPAPSAPADGRDETIAEGAEAGADAPAPTVPGPTAERVVAPSPPAPILPPTPIPPDEDDGEDDGEDGDEDDDGDDWDDDADDGPVEATCIRRCFYNNAERLPGDTMVFPNRDAVPPQWRVTD